MRSVFEGGVGWIRGGIAERSIDILCRDALEVGRVDCGELSEDMVKGWCFLKACKAFVNMMRKWRVGSWQWNCFYVQQKQWRPRHGLGLGWVGPRRRTYRGYAGKKESSHLTAQHSAQTPRPSP